MSGVSDKDRTAGIGGPLLNPSNAPKPATPDDPGVAPKHTWAIWIAEDCYLYTRAARPNWFRRFWLWAFFGWQWKKVKP